jgi:hypothetical protein
LIGFEKLDEGKEYSGPQKFMKSAVSDLLKANFFDDAKILLIHHSQKFSAFALATTEGDGYSLFLFVVYQENFGVVEKNGFQLVANRRFDELLHCDPVYQVDKRHEKHLAMGLGPGSLTQSVIYSTYRMFSSTSVYACHNVSHRPTTRRA